MEFLQPQITIHLGDVYYAGTSDQEKHLLVNLWPKGSIGAATLNSNHEMYSGGLPYFNVALTDSLFALQQGSSFFALQNDFWVVVALDSAYYASEASMYLDGALDPVQVQFLRAQRAAGKKVLLLTHHNGLTEDGATTTALWSQVMSAFDQGHGPDLWYWGHVHAGIVYDPQRTRGVLCRCCGHGGIPWGQASGLANSPNVLWYEKRPAHDLDVPQRVLNGFAMVSLSGSNVTEVFYDENGGVAWPPPR